MIISELQLDTLKEIINIGVGRSSSSLNKILDKRILLEVPVIDVIDYKNVNSRIVNQNKSKLSIVKMQFKGELSGICELVFSTEGASKIVTIILDDHTQKAELDDQLKINTLSEVGNMILNALMGTLGNLLKTRIGYNIPRYLECMPNEITNNVSPSSKYVIYAETLFRILNEDIAGSFILFFEIESFDSLLKLITDYQKSIINPPNQ
ncbi:hypothetical protein E9993_14830 [Labilibacter sediminis]|nr:hypothetical protein E9993_14830 [Labilibacter sediminis]